MKNINDNDYSAKNIKCHYFGNLLQIIIILIQFTCFLMAPMFFKTTFQVWDNAIKGTITINSRACLL